MRILTLSVAAISLFALPLGCTSNSADSTVIPDTTEAVESARFTYPESAKGDVVDDYHGTQVADPYRWLEDPDSPETKAWVEAQNRLTFGYLESLPARKTIRDRLTTLWNFERYGIPYHKGGRYFYSKNDGLQNQSVVYTASTLEAEPTVVLDPNKLSADGTVALSGMAVSPNGKLVAYGLSSSGSDWQEYRVREIDSGNDRTDVLKWIKFSGVAWTKDNRGFFYSRYAEPSQGEAMSGTNKGQKLYYHRLGDPQEKDVLIYENPDQPKWGYNSTVSDDGKYLVVAVWKGSSEKNAVFVKELRGKSATTPGGMIELLPNFDAKYQFIDNRRGDLWFMSNKDAPRGKVIQISLNKPAPEKWVTIIPEAKETLRSANIVGNRFFANYLKDAHSQVKIFDLKGAAEGELALPGIGTVYGLGGKRKDKETFYMFTGYTQPGTIYRYDVKSATSTVFREPKVDFNPADYVTEQIFYTSKDGTKVPMFLTHKTGLQKDGTNPTYLYGYGGFNIAITPTFSVANLVWLEMGGVLAVANLRGGGEYGEAWHQAGTKLNKQNVFDDFIGAAEWLIANKYTSSEKLAIGGRSNGGLLVGATMTQRPDLFKVALPGVGVLDMLRFHKFTIGWAWVSDYGSSEDPEQFKALYAYSPLHNLKPDTAYPATMIHTADHDDRVVPGHSFKFAAALQAAHKGDDPVMIRIETKAGHGAGKPTSKRIEEAADLWAFVADNLGMQVHFGPNTPAQTPEAAPSEAAPTDPVSEAAPEPALK